ncbi:MAG: hypothetical protein ACR2IV_18420 [Bryobacteraceae bacterium]
MRWKSYFNRIGSLGCLIAMMSGSVQAQQESPDVVRHILDRLDALDRQNQALLNEVHALREEIKASRVAAAPQTDAASQKRPLDERLGVAEQRIKEQAQTKVESSQRFPITLNGMLLFDAFLNSREPSSYGQSDAYGPYGAYGGATLRQSILGLEFRGPHLPRDGRVHGSLSMDFFAENPTSDNVFRIRTGVLSFDWTRRSLTVGQDKSIIAPLQPTSFARVGIPPLSGAGNLWLWRPQIRYEERIPIATNTQAILQLGLVQTDETYSLAYVPSDVPLETSRPAVQARVELRHQWQDEPRVAVGFGFHSSESHILGRSVDSRVISGDLFLKPLRKLEFTGTLFRGQNFANIGGGPPGITVTDQYIPIPIHGTGGWMQLAFPVTNRLTFDLYGGRQLNDARDLVSPAILRTFTYAGNVLYHLGPNVIVGLEASQERLAYLDLHQRLTNRYDASVAYLF